MHLAQLYLFIWRDFTYAFGLNIPNDFDVNLKHHSIPKQKRLRCKLQTPSTYTQLFQNIRFPKVFYKYYPFSHKIHKHKRFWLKPQNKSTLEKFSSFLRCLFLLYSQQHIIIFPISLKIFTYMPIFQNSC